MFEKTEKLVFVVLTFVAFLLVSEMLMDAIIYIDEIHQ